jgi:hypothetical protein
MDGNLFNVPSVLYRARLKSAVIPHLQVSASRALVAPTFKAEWASGSSIRRVFVVCVQSHKKE